LSVRNLKDEGFSDERIVLAGNVMIDTLDTQVRRAAELDLVSSFESALLSGQTVPDLQALKEEQYAVVTLHRPSNVDNSAKLANIVRLFERVGEDMPLLWTLHPRTHARLKDFGLWDRISTNARIMLLEPLDYLVLLRLNQTARLMITDSGGLQGECCVLGTPALILFETPTLPETYIDAGGTNILAQGSFEQMTTAYEQAKQRPRHSHRPPCWDGHAAERMVEAILNY
jgi:UDP-N-acetylglucosamine 2-epimerase (non-hydrolysing)